jgi:hypothetical protein
VAGNGVSCVTQEARVRTFWIAALALALSGCVCHSHLLGAVEDQASAQPVAGALVKIEGTEAEDQADSAGAFEVDAVCRSTPYVVAVTALGYEDLRVELVLEGHEVWRDFLLVPRGTEPAPAGAKRAPRRRGHEHSH